MIFQTSVNIKIRVEEFKKIPSHDNDIFNNSNIPMMANDNKDSDEDIFTGLITLY